MGPTKHLLRHFSRRHLLSPRSLSLTCFHCSPVLFNYTKQPTPSLNPNPDYSSRSFSWIPWTRSPNSDSAGPDKELQSEFSSIDGTESSNVGIFEEDGLKCQDNGSGSVGGYGSGLDAGDLDLDTPWYSPFREGLIWMMDGVHDISGLPWWLVISLSTLTLRVSLLPILILQLKKMERIANMMPEFSPGFFVLPLRTLVPKLLALRPKTENKPCDKMQTFLIRGLNIYDTYYV